MALLSKKSRRYLLAASLALIVALVVGPAAPAFAAQPAAAKGQRYIVVLRDTVEIDEAVRGLGAQHGLALGHVFRSALRGFAATVPPGRLAALARDPRVAFIEPDLEVTIAAELRTGVDRVDADRHPLFVAGKAVDVDIAILDTGIDPTHPDLNVVGGVSFVPGVSSYADDHGHGSHVAGIAAAEYNGSGVVGVAPGARLWAVKVLSSTGSGSMSDIIKGIDWVTQRAATIEVANMSLGATGRSDALRAALQRSVAAGVVHVVAAGNSGRDVYGADGTFGTSDDFIPASYPEVATISALADTDGRPGGAGYSTSAGPDDTIASFSNYGRSVIAGNPVKSPGGPIDVAAPGVGIYSTWARGGYNTASGTSMASPHAAGVIALYMAHNKIKPSSAAGVYAVRQAIIDAGQPQSQWRQDGNTRDRDAYREPLAHAGNLAGAPPPPPPPPPPAPEPEPEPTLGVSVSPATQSGQAWAGASTTYTFTVKNTGTAAGVFAVSTAASWASSASPASVSLAAGASAVVSVTHTVPAGAAPGASDTGRLTVSVSTGGVTGASASGTYTTAARGYGVTLSPANQTGSVAPGSSVSYTYTIKNTGSESDTYSLTAEVSATDAGAGWEASVSPASIALAVGQSASVVVTHSVPGSATGGAVSAGTLRASSNGGGAAAKATAGFTTTAQSPSAGLNVKITVTGSPGGLAQVTVVVTDSAGRPVPSALVAISLRTATRLYSGSRYTDSAGVVRVWAYTYSNDYFPWTVKADASKNGVNGTNTVVYPAP